MDFTRDICKKMLNEQIMFVYRGVVTNENSSSLLLLLENEMKSSEYGNIGRKRLFMFVLESLQNVSRHSDNNQYADMSIVIYAKSKSGYTVTTGNVIQNDQVDELKSKLENVNNIQTNDIRNVYRQALSEAKISSKGGAGLGLIEMAKKTGNKLDFDFIPVDDKWSYFILSKTVDSGGTSSHDDENEKKFNGNSVTDIERMMRDGNIYFVWSGHLSHNIGKEVISFAETKLSEEGNIESSQRKKIFRALVELLESAERKSLERDVETQYGVPMVMIRFVGKTYYLTAGYLVPASEVDELKNILDEINEQNKDGLKDMFVDVLESKNNNASVKMSLVEVAKKSGSKLEYKFDSVNSDYAYYTLTVGVVEGFQS